MQISVTTAAVVVVLVAALGHIEVAAWPKFLSLIPNGRSVPFNKVDLGHAEGTLERNPFGRNFNVDRNWSKTLCEADSDSDGQTNGQELGDPCCVWVVGNDAVLLNANFTSNPGNKSSLADPAKWKDLDCTSLRAKSLSAATEQAPAAAAKSTAVSQEKKALSHAVVAVASLASLAFALV